jgi:hypothetical protein
MRCSRYRRGPSRVVNRVLTILVAAGLVGGAVVALRPPAAGLGPGPTLTGMSLLIPPPEPVGAAARPITATYRVTTSRHGESLHLRGLTGPYLLSSSVRASTRSASGGASLVTLRAVADCRSPASLGAPTGRYVVVGRLTRFGFTSTRFRSPVPTSPVNWAAAVRQDCWQRVAARGVAVADVVAAPDPTWSGVLLAVHLASSLDMDVRVGAVDVADVSTLEAAETGILPAGGSLVLHVRQPVRHCGAVSLRDLARAGSGPGLPWSVGPVDGDAAATFVTMLAKHVTSAIRKSVDRFCAARAPEAR